MDADLALVPPQNPVDGAIVGVSVLGVKLAYPDASLAVRPARNRQTEQVLTAPRSPWQNPYCERVIGTLRRAASSLHTTRCLTQSLGPTRNRA
jgi:hypothetical protein